MCEKSWSLGLKISTLPAKLEQTGVKIVPADGRKMLTVETLKGLCHESKGAL